VRRLLILLLALAIPATAHADLFEQISDGAPIYASLRPLSLEAIAKRLGAGQLPEVQQLKAQLGRDPLDPALLSVSGLDVAAPIAASFYEPVPGGRYHHRVVATLHDKLLFGAFFAGLMSSGAIPVSTVAAGSALARLGVTATAKLPDGSIAILRYHGDTLIVDAEGSFHGKAPAAAEVARRFPLAVRRPFVPEHGARRLFQPGAALVIYTDGRRLPALLETLEPHATKKSRATRCGAEWDRASASFDDAGLSVSIDPTGLELQLAWGTLSGPPLGGLRFHPVDDGSIDVGLLAHQAPAVLALYSATLTPFESLKRSGPLASSDALLASISRCGDVAWGAILVRAWPQAIGAMIASARSQSGGNPIMVPVLGLFGQLRNVVLVLRDAGAQQLKYAMAATFDGGARAALELFLGASAPGGAKVTPIGRRTPSVYHLALSGVAAAAAVDTLTGGPVALTIADSDSTLAWVLRTLTRLPGAPAPAPKPTPILALHLDTAALSHLSSSMHFDSDTQLGVNALARLSPVDASLTTDGDLFRLTVRAPVKP
jgi:hypothetical protein